MRSLYLWLVLLFSIVPSVSSAASTPTPVTNFRNYSTLQQLGAGPENTLLYKGRQIVAGGGGGSATVQNLTFQAGSNATITGNDDAKTVTFGVYSSPTFHDVIAKGPVVDVRHPSYAGGAKCDGATDDTAAIQAAIDAAAPQGKVQLCKGTAVVSQLRLPSYVELAGYGIGSTVLKQKGGSNKDMIVLKDNTVQMVTLHDFSIDGNKANQTSGNGINFTNSYTVSDLKDPSIFGEWDARHQIHDIYIQQVKEIGVILAGRGETQISNVEVRYCDKNAFYFAAYDLWADRLSGGLSGEHGLILAPTYSNAKIANSKMWMSGRIDTAKGDGFHVEGVRNTITGCEAQDNAGYGIALVGGDNIVTGFIAEANGWFQNFYGTGLDYRKTDSAGIYINSNNNLLVFTAGDRFSSKQDRAVWISYGSGNMIEGVSHDMSIEAIPYNHLYSTANQNRVVIYEYKKDDSIVLQSNLVGLAVNQSTFGVTAAYVRSLSALGHTVGPILRIDTDTDTATVLRLEKYVADGTDATKKRWDADVSTNTGNLNLTPLNGGTLQYKNAPIAAKVSVPSSATASGEPGQWAADSSYLYTYTGDGTTHSWKRAAIAAW